jgi:hypothetical protein
MKLFKVTFIILCLSFILSTGTVIAYEVHGFINISLGGGKGIYTSSISKTKTGDRTQRTVTDGAIEDLTGKKRAVEVRVGALVSGTTYQYSPTWIETPANMLIDLPYSKTAGTYKFQTRAVTNTPLGIKYSGRWYYQL